MPAICAPGASTSSTSFTAAGVSKRNVSERLGGKSECQAVTATACSPGTIPESSKRPSASVLARLPSLRMNVRAGSS